MSRPQETKIYITNSSVNRTQRKKNAQILFTHYTKLNNNYKRQQQ